MKKTLVPVFAVGIAAFSMVLSAPARAVPIAIIDSGTALEHPDLVNHAWTNIYDWEDGVDNDDNGYIDDVHGWNFADGNNKLYNKKLLGTFSPDVYKFFDVQTRVLKGTATAADIAWIKSIRGNAAFIAQLEAFGNWVHGTHVAGIASKDSPGAQIMPLKTIGGSSSAFLRHELFETRHVMDATNDDSVKVKLIKLALGALASVQGTGLAPIGQYAAMEGAKVANCSFGSSATQIQGLIGPIISKVMGRPLTAAELSDWTNLFLNEANDSMRVHFIAAAPDTLFVIAAGNDGTNNDVMPTVPANVKAENTITVAATLGLGSLASFSNYGAVSVDVAAPGVGILSSIPGDAHLTLSGTSQATPYVTNVAGKIRDAGPNLTIPQVKELLMRTVDHKDFLQGKVVSSGIVNGVRAVRAAELMVANHTMDDSVGIARAEIPDMSEPVALKPQLEQLYVTPLTALFQ
jgi:subtilisin family serine protease